MSRRVRSAWRNVNRHAMLRVRRQSAAPEFVEECQAFEQLSGILADHVFDLRRRHVVRYNQSEVEFCGGRHRQWTEWGEGRWATRGRGIGRRVR